MAEIGDFFVAKPRRGTTPPSAPLLELTDFVPYHGSIAECRLVLICFADWIILAQGSK